MIDILLSILALIALSISLPLIVAGIKKKVPSCYKIGGSLLMISIFTAVCYFFNWPIPMIVIFGLAGTILTYIGSSAEDDPKAFSVGVLDCFLGIMLYIASFYYWYQSGCYLSLAIFSWLISCIYLINIMQAEKGVTPKISIVLSIIFAAFATFLWYTHNLDGITIFMSGCIGSLLLNIIWNSLVVKKWQGLTRIIRSYESHDSFLNNANYFYFMIHS